MRRLFQDYPLVAWPIVAYAGIVAFYWWCPGRLCVVLVFIWWPQEFGGGLDSLTRLQTLAATLAAIAVPAVVSQILVGRGRPADEEIVIPAASLLLLPPALLFWGAYLLD